MSLKRSVEHKHGGSTTHAATAGAGRPRLVFVVGSDNWHGDPAREFLLTKPVTRIGSGPDMDLVLPGLDALHAEIHHDERDEYVLFTHGVAALSEDDTQPGVCAGHVLRTGWRVELGTWAMSFAREEFADHGRPFGGRQGGELAHQPRQPDRPHYPDAGSAIP